MRERYTQFNQWLAVRITNGVSTMECAYCFFALALIGFPGLHATPQAYVQWVSQTVIQLVMLSVIMVGQKILSDMQSQHHTEIKQLHQRQQEAYRQHKNELHALHESHAALHVKIDSLLPQSSPSDTPPKPKRSHHKKVAQSPTGLATSIAAESGLLATDGPATNGATS